MGGRFQLSESGWEDRLPAAEARDLYALVRRGVWTVEEALELITVPPSIEAGLRSYARIHPEASWSIDHIVGFRRQVAEEFERLVRQDAETKRSASGSAIATTMELVTE